MKMVQLYFILGYLEWFVKGLNFISRQFMYMEEVGAV